MKKLAALGALALAAPALVGCSSNYDNTSYRPAAFGENNMCYYMQTQAEADMLIREGLCQPTWRPAQAPWSWQIRYVKYYESDEYANYYVPASSRTIYRIYTREFDSKWSRDIKAAQRSATYVDNKGRTVKGDTVQVGQFGGGVRTKGGSGIRTSNGKTAKKVADSYYKKSSDTTAKKSNYSSGGGYKSGSKTSNSSGWSSKSSSTGGGIRTSRR
jgi:hypothetical protein